MNTASARNISLRRQSILRMALAAALTMTSACRESDSSLADSPAVTSVVNSNTEFALDLYQQLKTRPGNLFFSPFSISTSLAMTYAGARGQTENEMAKTLHLSLPQQDLHMAYGKLTAWLGKVQNGNRVVLATANSLWCQQEYRFTDSFLNIARTQYRADIQSVDFKNAAESARAEINSWVEQKTKGRIKNLVAPNQFTSDTLMVLCNAVYFKGTWQKQFDPKRTKSLPFVTNGDNYVDVPMMDVTSKFTTFHAQNFNFKAIADNFKAIVLPYAGGDFSMIVFLPDTYDGLPNLERRLNADNLHKWIAELDQTPKHTVSVRLPRVKITQEFQLVKVLSTLGMPSAFSLDADLTGMSSVKPLFLSDSVHKAFVEINEEGTEAAAATAHIASRSQGDSFLADHPFIFLIRENRSGSILFIGRVSDPSKES